MTAGAKGRSLELFFIDGKPDAMLTAEVFNWTGHVLMTPRTQISEALKRKEARHTGIYLLFGERNGSPLLYIGEGEDISDRIRNHDSRKDWWNIAILITSSANNLNKAHVKYLESRLIEEARAVGKIALENGTVPGRPGLSEAAQANMEAFIEYVLMVLPALQIDSFLKNTRPATHNINHLDSSSNAPLFELHTAKHGISATAKLENGEFVVQAGSNARRSWEGVRTQGTPYGQLHTELVRMGVLVEQGLQRVFKENYAFKSPSAAAAVVNGRPANGTVEWKVKGQNKNYKQWEAEKLARENTDLDN